SGCRRLASAVTTAGSVAHPSAGSPSNRGITVSPSPLFSHLLRQPTGRLSRRCDDLSALGRRLCEGIATLAGRHAGDVVRAAVEAALGHASPDPDPQEQLFRPHQDHQDSSYHEPHRERYRDRYTDERHDRYGDYHADNDPWSAASPEPALPSCVAPDFPPA